MKLNSTVTKFDTTNLVASEENDTCASYQSYGDVFLIETRRFFYAYEQIRIKRQIYLSNAYSFHYTPPYTVKGWLLDRIVQVSLFGR